MNCYACDTELTSTNETEEHIIINAAGGRLKSKKLICIRCNSRFGNSIDSALASQVNNIANMLMINRQKGEPRPIIGDLKSTGEKYLLPVGGKPELAKPNIQKTVDGKNINISIEARNEKEMRKILQGFAKKYPGFDVERAMESTIRKNEYLKESLHFKNEIGGKNVFKAVCKCSINYFLHCGGDVNEIKHLLPYLINDEELKVVWMHYQDNLYPINSNESFHVLNLVGNKTEKILYCYVDYFNTYKCLVLLSENYNGAEIRSTYAYDVLNLEQKSLDISMDYDRQTVLNFRGNQDTNLSKQITESFNHSISLGLRRQDDAHRSELLAQVIEAAFGQFPEGAVITPEMMKTISDDVINGIMPYLIQRIQ